MEFEIETGQRGSQICIYNSHRYRHIRNNKKGSVSWRCINKECSAAILIDSNKFVIEKGQHDHEPHQNLEQQCIRGMKRRAEQETTAIPKVYEQESIKFFMQTGGILPVFNSVRSSLYRCRNSSLPVIPHNLTEFDIPDDWKKDNLGGDFLQINVGTDARLLGFVSQCGLERLAEAKHWNADGTFYTAPRLFSQAYTIHSLTGKLWVGT
ncbi:unnamed protein product [Didymodactylos carnosus]|uniref:FLYWCH-type domain-containing protein n=1 Tax=Didymodactylos carnosus TaxID=1234261 RepID=A0A815WXR0_9BILA|nr:unnamed protein product [Didymodactylos carnosus]CAF4408467.1 unnamed protein product [Didymodactylos carnosus]